MRARQAKVVLEWYIQEHSLCANDNIVCIGIMTKIYGIECTIFCINFKTLVETHCQEKYGTAVPHMGPSYSVYLLIKVHTYAKTSFQHFVCEKLFQIACVHMQLCIIIFL